MIEDSIYLWAATIVGYLWMLMAFTRLPAIYFDARIFYRCLRSLDFQKNRTWFTLRRVVIADILGAPRLLWMDPGDYLRRTPAADVYDRALSLIAEYAPSEEIDIEDLNLLDPQEFKKEAETPPTKKLVPFNRRLLGE
jgi:hypothetical protein